MKLHPILLLFTMTAILGSCEFETEEPREVLGLRPVYGTMADLEVKALPARELCKPGKIYAFGTFLFINEQLEGIHIIDNANPSKPEHISFLKIPGNVDMAVKDGYLYADHLSNMAVIDIRNPMAPRFLKSVENTFDHTLTNYPPISGVSFECVDPGQGIVIGWTEAFLKNPKCFR